MREPLATEILETVPLIMHELRREVRRQRDPSVTIEEFRVMIFIGKNTGGDLSSVADYVGLSLPSVSKIVDALIKKEFIVRTESKKDRRRLTLSLTGKGHQDLEGALRHAESYIAQKVNLLGSSQQKEISQALQLLRIAFGAAEKVSEQRKKMALRNSSV